MAYADVFQNQLLSSDYSKSMAKHSQLVFKQDQESYITYLNQSFDYQIDSNGYLKFNDKGTFADQLQISKQSDLIFQIKIPSDFKPENFSVASLNDLKELDEKDKNILVQKAKKDSINEQVDVLLDSQKIRITLLRPKKYICFSFENNFTYFRSCVLSEILTPDEMVLSQLSKESPELFLNKDPIENQGTVLLQNISEPVNLSIRYKDQLFMNWIVLKRYPLLLRIDRDFENKKYSGYFYDFTMENFIWKSEMDEKNGFFNFKNDYLIELKQEFSFSDLFFKNQSKSLKFSLLRIKKKIQQTPIVIKKEKLTQFYLSITNSSFKRTDETFEAELFSKMNFGFSFYHQMKIFNSDWILGGSFDQMQILDNSDSILIQNKSNSLMSLTADMPMSISENLIFTAGFGLRDHVLFATNASLDSVAVNKILLPEILGQGILRIPVSDEFVFLLPIRLAYSLGGSADGQKYGSSILMTLGYRLKYITEDLDFIIGGDSVLSTRNVNNYAQKSNSGKFYLGIGYDF